MHINDATKILGLTGKIDADTVKAAYRQAAKKYHPDRNPAGLEMMKMVNEARDTLLNFDGVIDQKCNECGYDYGDEINEALNKIIALSGLEIEVCGSWVWVSGDTKTHKDALKEAGFKWARKKQMWHFRPNDYKSFSRGRFSMDEIREKHGSTRVRGGGHNRIGGQHKQIKAA